VEDFRQVSQVGKHVGDLLAQCRASGAAAAIIPWINKAFTPKKLREIIWGRRRDYVPNGPQKARFAVSRNRELLQKRINLLESMLNYCEKILAAS
jgi:hypothetical protein